MSLQIIKDFSSLIGVPYDEMDCWGVVVAFYKLHGYCLPNFYDLATRPCHYSTQELISTGKTYFVERSYLEYGSIVLLRLHGVPTHIAVFVGGGKILHTNKATGCVIESIRRWQPHIEAIYDYV